MIAKGHKRIVVSICFLNLFHRNRVNTVMVIFSVIISIPRIGQNRNKLHTNKQWYLNVMSILYNKNDTNEMWKKKRRKRKKKWTRRKRRINRQWIRLGEIRYEFVHFVCCEVVLWAEITRTRLVPLQIYVFIWFVLIPFHSTDLCLRKKNHL